MRRRVHEARVGRLASVHPDGRPHVVPCCFVADGEVIYSAVDAKPKSSLALRRLENVRVTPSVSLLIRVRFGCSAQTSTRPPSTDSSTRRTSHGTTSPNRCR